MGVSDFKSRGVKIHFLKMFISAVIVVAIIAFVTFFIVSINDKDKVIPQKINTGWDVVINDEVYEDVELSSFVIPKSIEKGDVVILKNTIPEELQDDVSCIMFQIYLSAVEARIDGQTFYKYGFDEYEEGEFLGSGYHFLQLPYESTGKEFTIILKPAEKDAFTNIPVPEIVSTKYAPTSFTDKNILTIFVCVFLFVLGVVITIISGIALYFDDKSIRLVVIGILATFIGAWSMCNGCVLQMFSTNLAVNTTAEYICLFVAPIPLLILINIVRLDELKWKKIIIYAGIAIISVFDIVAVILHFTDTVHLPKVLTIFHVLALVVLLIVFITGRKKFKNMEKSERVLNFSIIVLCLFAGIDIIRFNFSKYFMPGNETLSKSILPIGTLIFVVLLLISYLYYMYGMVRNKAESVVLSKMAYNDSLTGLSNRAKAEEIFKELEENEQDYFIVNIDLNNLKRINDKYGHEKGDNLIKIFANILNECFSDIGTSIRMGGDEFIVVVYANKELELKNALKKMIELEAKKSKEIGMKVEASFGIASNIEDRTKKPEQVYSIADGRMYKQKQLIKAKRK